MTDFTAERRAQLREDGLQALGVIVKAIRSHPGTGQAGKLVRFVAGCYNAGEYPFELDLLRGLDTVLAASCLTYLAYDALGEKEIHHHIPGGGETVQGWLVEYGLRPVDRSLRELSSDQRVDVNATLVTYGHAPGYRDLSLVFDVEPLGGGAKLRLDMHVGAKDGVTIRHHIQEVHRSAWEGKGPIDRGEGEQRPAWLR